MHAPPPPFTHTPSPTHTLCPFAHPPIRPSAPPLAGPSTPNPYTNVYQAPMTQFDPKAKRG
eukprot:scaffold69601_cov45-Phaeocystis_antarctica.AAC.2